MVVAQVVAHQAAAGSWAFFSLFSFLSFNQWFVLNQVPRGGATLLVFNIARKNEMLSNAT